MTTKDLSFGNQPIIVSSSLVDAGCHLIFFSVSVSSGSNRQPSLSVFVDILSPYEKLLIVFPVGGYNFLEKLRGLESSNRVCALLVVGGC